MTTELELAEWSTLVASVGPPTASDLELAERLEDEHGRKLDITWLHDGRVRIRSTSWIGMVQFTSFRLRIVPKLVGAELGVLRMLEYAGRFDRLTRLDVDRTIAVDGRSLPDLLCELLHVHATALLRTGLIRDYATQDEALPALRGSLRYRDQVLKRYGQLDVLECRFDEFDGDIIENQLLLSGLAAAARLSRDDERRRSLRQLTATVLEVCRPGPSEASWYQGRVSYHRRNAAYRAAHEISLLVLRGMAFDDLYDAGTLECFAFLLDMNQVFEDFVGRLAEEALEDTGWSVDAQRKVHGVITTESPLRTHSTIRPDLVVTRAHEVVPFDTKYKQYDAKKVSTSDVYQSFVYGFALGNPHSPARAGILYPTTNVRRDPPLFIRRPGNVPLASVHPVGIDVPAALDALDAGGSVKLAMLVAFRGELLTVAKPG